MANANKIVTLFKCQSLLAGQQWPTNWGHPSLNYNKVKVNLRFTKYKIALNSIHDKRRT